jgi:hypothetical protein
MIGDTPSVAKKPAVAWIAGTSSAWPPPTSVAPRVVKAAVPSKLVLLAFQSSKSGYEATSSATPLCRSVAKINTSRPACGNGNGRSSTALTTLKIAALAPMPRPSVSTATAVKPGALRNMRTAPMGRQ